MTPGWATMLVATCTLLVFMPPPAAYGQAGLAQSAVDELNRYRAAAGVTPVTLNVSSAAQRHAHYLAINEGTPAAAGLRGHSEDPSLPGHTPEGDAVARRSHLATNSSVEGAIGSLVNVPLHRRGMLAPGLSTLGVGVERRNWVIDLSSTVAPPDGQPRIVAYPAPGQMDVPLAFDGNENPNPLTAIPGLAPDTRVGFATTLDFYGCDPTEVDASLSAAGTAVPIYLIKPGTVVTDVGGSRTIPTVLLFAQRPLQPSTTYSASVTATCQPLTHQTYAWSFTTSEVAASAVEFAFPGVDANLDSPDDDGSQLLRLRFYDEDGLPTGRQGGHVTIYWSGRGLRPQVKVVQAESTGDDDFIVQVTIGEDANLRLDLDVGSGDESTSLRVILSPGFGGPLPYAPPPADPAEAGPIRVDPRARAEWERSVGATLLAPIPPTASSTPPAAPVI